MRIRKLEQICMILVISLFISSVDVSMASSAEKEELHPFSFEKTSYGVEDSRVIAKKLVLTHENAEIININEPDLIVVKENVGNRTVKIYLVGNKGVLHTFILNPEDEWIKKLTSKADSERCIVNIDHLNDYDENYENSFSDEYEDSFKKVLNPETGKYDLLNVSTGTYFTYGFDDIAACDYHVEYDANYIPYRIGEFYGFLDKHGKKISDAKFKSVYRMQSGALYCYTGEGGEYAIVTADGTLDGSDLYGYRLCEMDETMALAIAEADGSKEEEEICLINTKTGEKVITENIYGGVDWKLLTDKEKQGNDSAYSLVLEEYVKDSSSGKSAHKTYLATANGRTDLNIKLSGDFCDFMVLGGGVGEDRQYVLEEYVYVKSYSYIKNAGGGYDIQYYYQGLIDCYGNKVYGNALPDEWDTKIVDFCGNYGLTREFVERDESGRSRFKIQAIDRAGTVYYEEPYYFDFISNMSHKFTVVENFFSFYLRAENKYIFINGKTREVTELKDLTENVNGSDGLYDNSNSVLQFDRSMKIGSKHYFLFYDGQKTMLKNLDAEQGGLCYFDDRIELIDMKENNQGKGLIYLRSVRSGQNIILNENLKKVFENEIEGDALNSNRFGYITKGLSFMYGTNIYNYEGKIVRSIKKESFGISKEGLFRVSKQGETGNITEKRYAYCDVSGNLITDYKFIHSSEFYHGIACVYYRDEDEFYDDMVGIIDTKGNILVSMVGLTYNTEKERFLRYSMATAGEGIILEDGTCYFYDFSNCSKENLDVDSSYKQEEKEYYSEMLAKAEELEDFKIGGMDVKFTVPEEIPVIGGGEISLDFSVVPIQFEKSGNKFRGGVGREITASDGKVEKSLWRDKESWGTWKKFVESQNEKVLKGTDLLAKDIEGVVSTPLKGELKTKVYGYIEGTLDGGQIKSVQGFLVMDIDGKLDKKWQKIIFGVPMLLSATGKVGLKQEYRLGIDLSKSELLLDGKISLTLPEIMLSVGPGVAYIADVSVYGKIDNVIEIEKGHVQDYVDGELGAKASIFSGEVNKSLWQSKKKVIYDNTGGMITAKTKKKNADIIKNDFIINRDDTEKTSGWIQQKENAGEVPGMTILQDHVYKQAYAQMITTDDGTTMMVYVADDRGRTLGNHTVLMYSLYNTETEKWNTPKIVEDDGTADFYPTVSSDGKEIYVAWVNMNKSDFDKGVTVKEYAEASEISVAHFNKDTEKFEEAATLTDNAYADVKPSILCTKGRAVVAWIANMDNSILDLSGENQIHYAIYEDGSWKQKDEVYIVEEKPITCVKAGVIDGKVNILYALDEDGQQETLEDSYLFAGELQELPQRVLLDLDGIRNLKNGKVSGEDAFFMCSSKGIVYTKDLKTCSYLDVPYQKIQDYTLINGKDVDLLVCSVSEKNKNDLAGYILKDHVISNEIPLTNQTAYIENPSGCYHDGKFDVAFIKSDAKLLENDMAISSDLCMLSFGEYIDLKIETAGIDESQIIPGGKTDISIIVKNQGTREAKGYRLVVKQGESVIGDYTESDVLAAGDDKECSFNINIPKDANEEMELTCEIDLVSDENNENNFKKIKVGHPDLDVEVFEGQSDAYIYIYNNSYVDTDVVMSIYKTDQMGELLRKINVGGIKGTERKKIILTEEDLSQIAHAGDSLYVLLQSSKQERYLSNNYQFIYMKNKLVSAICLNEKHIELSKIGQEKQISVEVMPENATEKKLLFSSSDLSVAKVTQDGMVKAMGEGTSHIAISTTDGSEISEECLVTVRIVPDSENSENGTSNPTNRPNGIKNPKPIRDLGKKKPSTGTVLRDKKNKVSYKVIAKGKAVTFYKANNKRVAKVVVPAAVTLDGVKYRVTSISDKAFDGCKKLKSITIGRNVTKIGNKAFFKCISLKKVIIPAKVARIGKKAFYGCKKLKSVTLKSKKLKNKSVGMQAFKGIHEKAVFKIPKKNKKAYQKWLKKKGIAKTVKIK